MSIRFLLRISATFPGFDAFGGHAIVADLMLKTR
jgi:hypothetical protein